MENDFSVLLKTILDTSGIQGDVSKLEKELAKKKISLQTVIDTSANKKLLQEYALQIQAIFKNQGIDIDISKITSSLNQASKQVEATTSKLNNIQVSIDTEKYSTEIYKLQQTLNKFGSQSGETFTKATISLRQLEAAYKGMQTTNGDKRLNYEKEYQTALSTTKNLLSQIKSVKANELLDSGDYRRSNFVAELNNYLLKNTAMTEQNRQKILQWIATLSSADEITRGTFDNIKKEYKSLDVQLRQTGQLGLSVTDKLKQAWEKFGGWSLATTAMMSSIRSCKEMTNAVYEIDTAMTELAKVSKTTNSRLDQSLDKSTETAKEYGATINDVAYATADWSRLGYNMNLSEKLAEAATIYKNVGDGIDIDTANESLVSTLQGFQLDADEVLSIIDKFNEVANNFPIDTAGIGEALQRSAASFYAANTNLSKSIALITGTNSVVQDPDSVGTMWKTVSMRIRGTKQELEEAGEDTDGMVESTSELRDLVKGLTGFDIMSDKAGTQFKDVYDIVVGIGEKWKSLTDVEQAGLLETLAGKRQGNALSAALNNIDMIKEAYETAENSDGSAMKEQETYLSSLEAKTKQFEATFQSLSETVVNSDMLKFFMDFGTGTVSIFEKVISVINKVSSSFTSLGGLLGEGNSSFGGLGAISGLIMNIVGIGERTMFQW